MEREVDVGLSDGGGVFGFDCDCVYSDGFKCIRFHLKIWSCESGINWAKRERNREKEGEGFKACPIY